ncbi:MAG TPA: type II toxin-antitoxin system VapC family toxin [Bosea sp. (in: a-proteobacteria)]
MTLVDTNVLLDLFTADPKWSPWSSMQLDRLALLGPLAITDIVYAELSVRFATIEAVDSAIERAGLVMLATPRPALFLAGKAYRTYRQSGGTKTGVLPDFFIGAHAAVAMLPLLTRDPRRYRAYFPSIQLISP